MREVVIRIWTWYNKSDGKCKSEHIFLSQSEEINE